VERETSQLADRESEAPETEAPFLSEEQEAAERSSLGATSMAMVQRMLGAGGAEAEDRAPDATRATAQAGVADGGSAMPHLDALQESFGPDHDLSAIRAHVGGEAGEAADAIGAEAYATGHDVAFAGQPDLHTAAHEAAHVVQQQAGVQLKGGVGRSGDSFEREADQVADAVVAGESAAPILGKYAPLGETALAGGAVQMKKGKKDTSFVGGDGEESYALQGPDDAAWVSAGEGGYARTMQGATVQVAEGLGETAENALMLPVTPSLNEIENHVAIATWERDYYKRQKPWGAGTSVKKIWDDRISYADGKATQYTEDKRQQQANFTSYNAFVPLGNSLVRQLTRVEAQKLMLGISDDAAMTQALIDGMDDARTVGVRAQKSFDKNVGKDSIEAPQAASSVDGSAAKTRDAAALMDTAYVDFQQVLLAEEAKAIKGSGKEAEARLAEINEVRDFLKSVAKTVDFAHGPLRKAPEKIANAISNPASLAPSAEGATTAVFDFIYYEEVTKLTRILDNINGRIEKKNLVKEFAKVSAQTKAYKAAIGAFATAARDLQRALHDRRTQYRELGTKLDRFAQDDPTSRKEGLAPQKGGDRYATMLSLVVELRQAVALARFVKSGMPALEGGGDTGEYKAPAWKSWAQGIIKNRSHASYVPFSMSHPRVRMPEAEQQALEEVYKYLQISDLICRETISRYSGVDAAAGTLMERLGGSSGV
jgi:hypothetical protein